MGWFIEAKRVLRDEPGALSAVVGLACVLTSLSGMRLNALDGYYPIEASLVVRHLLAAAAAGSMVCLYGRFRGAFVLSRNWRRVAAIASCFALALLCRYSLHLLTISNGTVVLVGKLAEEAFGVLLVLAWGERILSQGFKSAFVYFSMAVTVFAGIQITLSFFQRVPCMVVLSFLPIISAILFKVYMGARSDFHSQAVPPAGVSADEAEFPVDLSRRSSAALYFGIFFCFIFVAGQVLGPTLEVQQQNVFGQLSIAFGNLIGGVVLLLVADRLDSIRTQLRLSMLVLFLVLFALTTVSFVLQSSLDIAALTVVCLTMLSAGMQLVLVLAWVAPFAILDEKWSPFAALALGYACHFASKSLSTVSMLMGQQSPAVPTSLITGLVLGVACALCVAFVLHLPESGPVGLPAQPSAPSVDAGRVKTPFKDVIAAVGARYGLTAQEERVLFFCAKGKNARAIADEMTVSLNTVKSHLRTLYAKLDVHSQQELIALVDAEVRGERVVR